jgi:subtilase family serine protease
MNQSLLALSVGLLLALPLPVRCAQSAGTVSLPGHVLPLVSQLQARGHLAATNLNLAIGLPLRNQAALTNLLEQINDPASPNYHKYLTPRQFNDQFAPSVADYAAVAEFARQHGLTVTGTHANRLLLDVRGLSTDIEKAFQISFSTYQHPTENRLFFAPDVEPSVPAGLPVEDISGLNNYGRALPRLTVTPVSALAKGSSGSGAARVKAPRTGSGPLGLYMGNDFLNAYVPGSPLNGSGQTIALVEFDGYYASDIVEYEGFTGRTNIPLQNILIDGFTGQPTGNGGEVEVSLDIDMAISMGSALSKVLVYEGNPTTYLFNDVVNRIATDNAASQIGCSWGYFGGPKRTTDRIFQQMALQGQSFFAASGDVDAYPAGSVDDPAGFGPPSDSPYVTSVGGTTLTMNSGATARVSETVWNYDNQGIDGVGSSGGYSTNYPIPYWQTNVNLTAAQGSLTYRNFPDVALTGDNVFVIADGGVQYGVSGTSCAAPLWAGFIALANQQATNFNRGLIGFVNPALYAIANSIKYASCFNDITTGSNTWSGSPALYYAVTNYDLCSGLGTPNGTNLINALVSNSVTNYVFKVSAPPAPYGTNLFTLNGGTPNGAWNLFIQDDYQFNTGMISNGWAINITLGSPLGSAADLGLTLAASATAVAPGADVVFYYTLTNYGGFSTATNVFVINTFTGGPTFISSNPSPGTTFQRNGDQFSWTIGNLVTNAGATLSVTVQAPAVAASIVASALAQSATPNPNPDDAQAFVSVSVGTTTAPTLTTSYNPATGQFILNVGGSTGTFVVEESTNLVNAAAWIPVATNTAPFSYTNSNTLNTHQLFFRAVTPASP